MPLPLSIFIVAHDEAERIGRTIDAVKDLTDDLVVIDSGSTDGTQQIAKTRGARVIEHPWKGYGQQKRFGEDQCRHDWVLNLDADEVATAKLCDEIRTLFAHCGENAVPEKGAYYIRIVDVIPGDCKPRLGAYAHKYIRLYHKSAGRFHVSSVHDVVRLEPGMTTRVLKGTVHHFSMVDFSTQIDKYNRYTDALVGDMENRGARISGLRMFTEFPLAFLKAYLLRRRFIYGRYGVLTSMNYAFFRYLRVAKFVEHAMRRRD